MAIDHSQQVTSAQVKSCILLAGLYADGKTTLTEPTATRDHTERMLALFGVDLKTENGSVAISGDARLWACDITVPGDISAAAFFMVAAACLDGSEITMRQVGINPLRSAICDVLKGVGADIQSSDTEDICMEPVATITVRDGINDKKPLVIDGARTVSLIDEIPILAVLGTQLEHGIEIRGAGELRVKESDRITAIVENLKRMRADVTESPDGFRVERSDLKGALLDSFGDHRIAMAFAVAGLLAKGETEIPNAECVAVSFPAFFETLVKAAA